MATYNFDLLDLADGESGDAAVSVVAGKKKTEAAAAKVADAADRAAQEKTEKKEKSKDFYFYKVRYDSGVKICEKQLKKLSDTLKKLRWEERMLREQSGNEGRLKELRDEQWKLRQEQMKLREEEAAVVQQQKAFYADNGIPLPEKNSNNDSNGSADPGSNYNGANGHVYNNNDGGSCGYSDYGGSNDNNGGQPRMKEHVIKVKPSSDAGTEAEEKPEVNVVSANNTEQKDASADNANAVPSSQSDKSATEGAVQDGSNTKGAAAGTKNTFIKKNDLNGSEKRKKKNAKKNSGTELVKKQDFEVDMLKKQDDKQPLEKEKKTLAEYERMRVEKKKSSEASKTEVRKVTAEEFKDLHLLERKKLDEEAVIKVEKAQPKVKEASKEGKGAAAKDGKPKKVIVPRQNLGFTPARRATYDQEDGSSGRGRFNGGFEGGSRDNSTKPQVNGRAAHNDAGSHNGNGAPRGAYNYNGRGDITPRGDYSGQHDTMGNGGNSYGRGNGGYGYGRGNGGYHGNNGGYQQQQAGNVGRQAGNGGYYQQQQGGNVGRQERAGNGGYYQQRNPVNDRHYQQRGNSGDGRNSVPAPEPDLKLDMSLFPALPAPASAPSVARAPASAPAAAQATAPAAASAQA